MVVAALKVGLRAASLVKLDPSDTYAQHSSLVLLQGSLRATNVACESPPKTFEKLPQKSPQPQHKSARDRLAALFTADSGAAAQQG